MIWINGDDFGMNERCTRAIDTAMQSGTITHTSMMANGEYFNEAAALAKANGYCERVGIHFNLTEGAPLTQGITRIADMVKDGRFIKDYLNAPRTLNESEYEAVYRELRAQAKRMRDAGFVISHADSHHYIHNLTAVAPIAAAVCREYGIRRVRLTRTFDPHKTAENIANAWWREQGFETAEQFGRTSDVQSSIPDGIEIMVHPDLDREGILIDRTGMDEGYPVGAPLNRIQA